jgi:hypothetical protein
VCECASCQLKCLGKKIDCIEKKIDHAHFMLHSIADALAALTGCCSTLTPEDRAKITASLASLKNQTDDLNAAVQENQP